MTYSRRVWLNPETCASTSSVVAYHGVANWRADDDEKITAFLEVADCHCKCRIHLARGDSMAQYAAKLRLLADEVIAFAEYCERESADA